MCDDGGDGEERVGNVEIANFKEIERLAMNDGDGDVERCGEEQKYLTMERCMFGE